MVMQRVAVIGAAGATARLVVEVLHDDAVEVVAVVRRPGSAPAGPGVREVVVDLAAAGDGLDRALQGCDGVVFAAAGDPQAVDRDGAIAVMAAAERVGVDRFVLLSALGAGRERPRALRGGFWDVYFGAKEAAEDALRAGRLRWTVVQPAELLGGPGRSRVWVGRVGELPIGRIARADVARVLVAALELDATVGRTIEVVEGDLPIVDALAGMPDPAGASDEEGEPRNG